MNYSIRSRDRQRLLWIGLACAVLLPQARSVAASHDDVLNEVALGVRKWLSSVESVEFNYDLESKSGLTSRVKYLQNGTLFRIGRADSSPLVTEGAVINSDVAFNGDLFQVSDCATKTLSVSRLGGATNSLMLGVDVPHIVVLTWLLDCRNADDDFVWSTTTSPNIVAERFAEARLVREKEGSVLVVRFPQHKIADNKWYYLVSFDRTRAFLPTLVERRRLDGDSVVWSAAVEDFIDAAEDTAHFPKTVRVKSFGKQQRETTLNIDLAGFKLNHPIDDGRFLISTDGIQTYRNLDEDEEQLKEARAQEVVPNGNMNDTPRDRPRLILYINAIVVVMLLGIVVVRRAFNS